MEIWKHLKTSGFYEVLLSARLQADGLEGPKQIVYRSMQDGTVWIRPAGEFMDGRFELEQNSDQRYDAVICVDRVMLKLGLKEIYDEGYIAGLKAAQS